MGKQQQKKWENGTKSLKFAKSVFFPDSKKKKSDAQVGRVNTFIILLWKAYGRPLKFKIFMRRRLNHFQAMKTVPSKISKTFKGNLNFKSLSI
jgi:hypothetical protein